MIARSEAAGTPEFRLLEVELGGRLTLDRITVRGGALGNGAGTFSNFGTLVLNDSTLESNHARDIGGGLASNGERAATTLNDSVVRGNTARFGGGLFNNGATTTLIDSHVVRNDATDGAGGGILNHGRNSALHLYGSTVTGNHAAGTAGGILNEGSVTASRSAVTGNSPNNCTGSRTPVPGCVG